MLLFFPWYILGYTVCVYHQHCWIVVLNGTQDKRRIAMQNIPIAATHPAPTYADKRTENKQKK